MMKNKSEPPKHLSPAAKKEFRKVLELYVLDDVGVRVLVTGLEAWDRAWKARETIDRHGMTIADRCGHPKVHPLIAAERDARSQYLQAMKLLNFSFGGETEKEWD